MSCIPSFFPGGWGNLTMRENLIETFRIMNGLDRVDMQKIFSVGEESRTRGHSHTIKGHTFIIKIRRNLFSKVC